MSRSTLTRVSGRALRCRLSQVLSKRTPDPAYKVGASAGDFAASPVRSTPVDSLHMPPTIALGRLWKVPMPPNAVDGRRQLHSALASNEPSRLDSRARRSTCSPERAPHARPRADLDMSRFRSSRFRFSRWYRPKKVAADDLSTAALAVRRGGEISQMQALACLGALISAGRSLSRGMIAGRRRLVSPAMSQLGKLKES